MKKTGKPTLIVLLSVLVTTLYPILFLYFRNIYEARERHLVLITLVYLVFSGLVYLVTRLIVKEPAKSAIIADIILVIVYNFEFIVSLIPNKIIGYVLATVFSVLILFFGIKLAKKITPDSASKINLVWAITLIALLTMNMIPAFPHMVEKFISQMPSRGVVQSAESTTDVLTAQEDSSEEALESGQDSSGGASENVQDAGSEEGSDGASAEPDIAEVLPEDYPNVYLMIFDEYGGSENLEHYYGFDNSKFLSDMQELGFNVSYNSYNLESPSTLTNIPNLLNLDYVVEHETEDQTYLEHLMNPYLYSFFRERGYDINTASYTAFLDNTQSTLKYDNKELYEDTISYFILKNSLFIHIYDLFIAPNMEGSGFASSSNSGSYVIEAMEFYKGFVNAGDDKPHFNLGYFSCPHVPICFRSDGTPFTDAELEKDQYSCYIEYLQWTSSRILDIADTILEADPDSIIVIMSDHGSRLKKLPEDDSLADPSYYKKNILNCVYDRGENIDISGLSGINTMITVLNSEFGTDFEMKEFKDGNQ
ncbi:MAG: hypothetical protein K5888_07710 [Lachnospiraceae bacterium]|nr:hypothetical protein [Lachnospiraceae bacterium]